MKKRVAELIRETGETSVRVHLDLDGEGKSQCETGVGFFEHMLQLLAHHSKVDLEIHAEGDLQVDDHHLVEDVGIVVGQALRQALGDKSGIRRYGSVLLPMDEVLVAVALDLSGRYAFICDYAPGQPRVGQLSTEMVPHFFSSLAAEARCNLHFRFLYPGQNEHHRVEAMFKGFARSLRAAVRIDREAPARVPSTKGTL